MTEGIHVTFTWHSMEDLSTCIECGSLNGYQWFDTDIYDSMLWSPFWGDVYDINMQQVLPHGGGHNCRCYVSVKVEVNLAEIPSLNQLSDILQTTLNEIVEVDEVSLR